MKEIEVLLSKLTGVKNVSQIKHVSRDRISKLENNYENGNTIGLHNLGIKMVLECDMVYAILKDTSFRPPPGATVFMVEDQIGGDEKENHILKIRDNNYHIIGEELIGKTLPKDEKYMFISNDFVLYPGRRKGRSKHPAYFLIPPIAFSELEINKDTLKISNIISVSPATMADEYIRELCGFSQKKDLATILVGFDKS